MPDVGAIVQLWRELAQEGQDWVLVTLIRVEGSSYRRPGARMLISAAGRRAGSISGGCLDVELAKQAFWLTAKGPIIRMYTVAAEDDDSPHPYGLGCGGKLHLLLERKATSGPFLDQLNEAYKSRRSLKTLTIVSGEQLASRIFVSCADSFDKLEHTSDLDGTKEIFTELCPGRVGLFIFGAGDDVSPLVEIARLQDWYIEVVDGRAHLATEERFPHADKVRVASKDCLVRPLQRRDAAVVMSHSFDQDRIFIEQVLNSNAGYIGVLGPRHRTTRLVESIAASTGNSPAHVWSRLHAPVGLPLGERTPAAIALGIAAEITLYMNSVSNSEGSQRGVGTDHDILPGSSLEEQTI